MGTAARIAHGISDTLLTRAADVMLKERRTLVVVPARDAAEPRAPREPHAARARRARVVLPAMPSFYGKPATLDDAIDTVVGRVLDHLGVEHDLSRRWGSP